MKQGIQKNIFLEFNQICQLFYLYHIKHATKYSLEISVFGVQKPTKFTLFTGIDMMFRFWLSVSYKFVMLCSLPLVYSP